MREAVVKFMKENELLQPKQTVLVGVSGGPDSLGLLHLLYSLKDDWDLKVYAITIDHQLRENSYEDNEFVQSFCKARDIPVMSMSVSTSDYKKDRGGSTQVAARHVRYEAFAKCMEQFEEPVLALGHHGDDQVETLLLQMMRTSDPGTLLGIPMKRSFANGRIIRPLLAVTKEEIYTYCKEKGLEFVIDPSNEEMTYTRNAIRQKVVPLLKERNERIHETIQQLSENLQADESYLRKQAEMLVQRGVIFSKTPRTATLNIKVFLDEPVALQRRAFHLVLNYLYNDLPRDLSHMHERLLFDLMKKDQTNQTIDFPQELTITRAYDSVYLRFKNDHIDTPFLKHELRIPGEFQLDDGSILKASYHQGARSNDSFTYILNEAAIQKPLIIRNVRQGDVMRWPGLKGSKKVRRIFIDKKVPTYRRESWPLVATSDGEVLWLIGLQKGVPKKQADQGRQIILSVEHNNNT